MDFLEPSGLSPAILDALQPSWGLLVQQSHGLLTGYYQHHLKMNTETPFEKFRNFTKKIVAVPKEEIDRREKAYKKARARKRKGL